MICFALRLSAFIETMYSTDDSNDYCCFEYVPELSYEEEDEDDST
jgi:hypothetical protein